MKVGTDGVLLGAWVSVNHKPQKILDIGSGTGLIGLMLAQRSHANTIDAVEIDKAAFEQTVENFEESPWSDRLFCYNYSFQNFAEEISKEQHTYDLIVSNPPFYNDGFTSKNVSRNKARSTLSLPFHELLFGVSNILSKSGFFSIIIPFKEEVNFISLAMQYGLFINQSCRVKGNKNSEIKRSLLSFSFSKTSIKPTVLTIEKSRNVYTANYIDLTKKFYLKM
tara:strand:+ start:419 stop:1087 length:669 start_codon:yes stop_codon:yes gene_type:complete